MDSLKLGIKGVIMDQKIIEKLYDDLKIDQKPGQGFKYVKTRYVLDRLNKAFNCNWGLEIKEHKVIDDLNVKQILLRRMLKTTTSPFNSFKVL